jgi:hypothetical protein
LPRNDCDGLVDEIDCGPGLDDTAVSYDRGLDVLKDCETLSPPAAAKVVGN